ncbi:MAG: LLM class flavin-dependent oxidoreductase, partial [Chloroflexota bacterium]|nr:LLM class flavin-dependent oxidoreductase [Chloroflexota bacterium]
MARELSLSVLDQSPIRQGGTAAQALRETVELAKATERFGYKRYWVAEHHNASGYAGAAPEILIGQIAAHTSTIRVGSGGVMLSHYAALKVAETFRALS